MILGFLATCLSANIHILLLFIQIKYDDDDDDDDDGPQRRAVGDWSSRFSHARPLAAAQPTDTNIVTL